MTESLTFWAAMIAIGWAGSLFYGWSVHFDIVEGSDLPEYVALTVGLLIFVGGSSLAMFVGSSILKKFELLRTGNLSHHLVPLCVGTFFAWARPNPDEELIRAEAVHMLHLGMEVYILAYFLCYLLLSYKLRVPLRWIHKSAPIVSALTVLWLTMSKPS